MTRLEQITQEWQCRLAETCPDQSDAERASILAWLLGPSPDCINTMESQNWQWFLRAMEYHHRILLQNYLNTSPSKGYEYLMRRLAGVSLIRSKLRTWLDQSRDRQRSFMMVLKEVVQEMLENDRYLQEQCQWLQQCTPSSRLRSLLLLASLEEYALRPIYNMPLILRRITNHVRSLERGGVTWAPIKEMIHMISDDGLLVEDDKNETAGQSHFNDQAIDYYERKVWEQDVDGQRRRVQQEFELYLNQELGAVAVKWLRLYLQGYSQEHIAERLGMSIKRLYRLREKVGYHAIKVFSVRVQPELVAEWLNISLQEHNFGLTPGEWQQFWTTLTPRQQLILENLRKGISLETIAETYDIRRNRVKAEWGRVYLAAQRFRNRDTIKALATESQPI
ncbi:MAG: HetZ-related protein 2 [Prochlorotrichaceae cyanobacterium]